MDLDRVKSDTLLEQQGQQPEKAKVRKSTKRIIRRAMVEIVENETLKPTVRLKACAILLRLMGQQNLAAKRKPNKRFVKERDNSFLDKLSERIESVQ